MTNKVDIIGLNKQLFEWWSTQLDLSRLIVSPNPDEEKDSDNKKKEEVISYNYDRDPSLEENTFKGFDGVTYDSRRNKTWVRFGKRDHIVWLENMGPKGIGFNEFMPNTNVCIFYHNFKGEPIKVFDVLGEYLENNWKDNSFFTLPLIMKGKFGFGKREKPMEGIHLSGIAKRSYTKKGLKGKFIHTWRLNLFKNLNNFYKEFKYSENHDDSKPREYTKNNINWPHRPSLKNGFIKHIERYTKEEALKDIEAKKKIQ